MSQGTKKKPRIGSWITAGVIVVLLVAMGLGTKVISADEVSQASGNGLDPVAFAKDSYSSVVVDGITDRATEVSEVAQALSTDPAAAAEDFAVGSGPTATYSVTATGIAGERDPKTGYLQINVEGLPDGVSVAMQTGPALLGTALRDATGKATFEMFTNQLDFQSAGDQLNAQMKEQLLDKTDLDALSGKEITVVGAFQPVNPNFLLMTPVSIEVAK